MNKIKLKNHLQSLIASEAERTLEESQDEMDFSKICRTCLRETEDNDLSNETICIINSNGQLVRIYDMLAATTGLKIEPDDGLPHHLCTTCLQAVNSSYTFRTQSRRANEVLQGLVASVKDEVSDAAVEQLEEQPSDEEAIPEVATNCGGREEIKEIEHISVEDFYDDVQFADEILAIEQLEEFTDHEEKCQELHTELPANTLPCTFCSEVFFMQRDIIQHYKESHPKEKPFKCEDCLNSFTHIQSLRRHKKTHIASAKEKMCPHCSRMFHRSDDLNRHMRIHTDERPYSCNVCQKAFKQHTELKDHMLSHTELKMYNCAICEKEWRSRNGWYVHMKSHRTGAIKPRRRGRRRTALISTDNSLIHQTNEMTIDEAQGEL